MYCRIAGAAAFVQPLPYPSVSGKQIPPTYPKSTSSHCLKDAGTKRSLDTATTIPASSST